MSRRVKSPERRVQIVEAALELLAQTPIETLTTRQIAKRVGISQPALFKHFRSREQILLAAMDLVHEQLGTVANRVLDRAGGPLEQLRALAAALLEEVQRHPGLPRLLFSLPGDANLRAALGRLVSMQTSFVAELVRQGQTLGMFSRRVSPEHAATAFVGLIQSVVLRSQLFAHQGDLESDAVPLVELWLRGTCAREGEQPADAVAANDRPGDAIRALDVRPIIAGGRDPLDQILGALEQVVPSGVLALTTPFRPAPLITLLGKKGHAVRARQLDEKTWAIDIVVGGAPELHDFTDLPPPEPLERVLEASTRLGPDDSFLATLPRFPRLLIPRLEERRLTWAMHEYPNGQALLRLWRSA